MKDKNELEIIERDAGITADVCSMIQQTREGIARTVNTGLTLLYWRIGTRIQTEILRNERAEYGKEIVQSLSTQLNKEFGKGFSYSALALIMRFAKIFSKHDNCCDSVATIEGLHFKDIAAHEIQQSSLQDLFRILLKKLISPKTRVTTLDLA